MALQSFFDEFQTYFYMGGLALSTLGSLVAVVIGRLSRRKSQEELSRIDRLIGIADQALHARRLPRSRRWRRSSTALSAGS